MKKITSLILLIMLSLSLVLTGCNNGNTAEKTTEAKDSISVLNSYFESSTEGDNPLYGTWQMENYDYLSFIFRNDGYAEMAMGTEGNFTQLTIDENKKELTVSFILGLNGTYSYEFSDNNNTLTLTMEGEDTVLIRQDNYNFIPELPEKPVIDENILGWWKSEDGLIYYFGKDGIMYSNIITSETCYTYNAENGKINAVYDIGGDVNYDVEYEYKDGKLILDGNEYSPYLFD